MIAVSQTIGDLFVFVTVRETTAMRMVRAVRRTRTISQYAIIQATDQADMETRKQVAAGGDRFPLGRDVAACVALRRK